MDNQGRQHIIYQGRRVRCYQVGNGPDILFIHGAPGTIDDWLPMRDGLADRFRLTFYDRPGYGGSDPIKNGFTQDKHAEVALALIDGLGLENPVVVGHSFGGGIALAVAMRNPPHIEAFVCVSARAYPKAGSPMIFHLLRRPILGRALLAILRSRPGLMEPAITRMFHPNETCIPDGFVKSRTSTWLAGHSMMTLAHEDTNSSAVLSKMSRQYHELIHPFFLVHGQEDRNVPVDDAKRLHDNLLNSRLFILPETGHMVQFTRTRELADIIGDIAGGEVRQGKYVRG